MAANGHGGKRQNAGRKSKAEEDELRRLLDRNWPKKKRAEMIKRWSERAERGDLEAGKLLMAYRFGTPTSHVEHTGKDGKPIEHKLAGLSDEELKALERITSKLT